MQYTIVGDGSRRRVVYSCCAGFRLQPRIHMIDTSIGRLLGVGSLVVALGGSLGAQDSARVRPLVRYRIPPSAIDPQVRRFDQPNYVVLDSAVRPDAPLLLFMPGTGGQPQNTSEFADLAARQGYRVIGLEYVDTPAVEQVCPRAAVR